MGTRFLSCLKYCSEEGEIKESLKEHCALNGHGQPPIVSYFFKIISGRHSSADAGTGTMETYSVGKEQVSCCSTPPSRWSSHGSVCGAVLIMH